MANKESNQTTAKEQQQIAVLKHIRKQKQENRQNKAQVNSYGNNKLILCMDPQLSRTWTNTRNHEQTKLWPFKHMCATQSTNT